MFAELVIIFGLALTCLGAGIAAKAVMMTPEDALQVGYSRIASGDPEKDIELPMVQNLLRSSRSAKLGLQAIAAGTFLQMLVGLYRIVSF